MDQEFTTPMMKQYEEIKAKYQDCIVFYRLGDFYETFLEDAHITSRILDITLTTRSRGKDGRIPMAGVPYHAADSYLAKLVKAGYKVAICEQVSEPNSKGLIDREVVRVVTPGTILDEKALDKKEHNFIASIVFDNNAIAIAFSDISTGACFVVEQKGNIREILRNQLEHIHPSECVISENYYNNPELLKLLTEEYKGNITCFRDWSVVATSAEAFLKQHFRVHSLDVFGIADNHRSIEAVAGLLGYLQTTQKDSVKHITTIQTELDNDHVLMDKSTLLNLELFSTIRTNKKEQTLVDVLDETQTAMGGRMLRQWIRKPLRDIKEIQKRQDSIDFFVNHPTILADMREKLSRITDIERILSRISLRAGNARDLVNLKHALSIAISIKHAIQEIKETLISEITSSIEDSLQEIIKTIDETIVDNPPIAIKEGGIIKRGVDARLDMLRDQVGGGKEWLSKLEKEEREKTGIGSLKVRYNKVFGFYIEVSKANLHLVPRTYIRKQTLVNGERFITPELKKKEEMILSAEEEIQRIEYELFQETIDHVIQHIDAIKKASSCIATLDCLTNLAHIADMYHYTKPTMTESHDIIIKEGRHPVVERHIKDKQFVPNDVTLSSRHQQLLIITGPNMAGKSVFIRQVALIVLMAHMGSFVPATESTISIVDRIFVRSGASDAITSGLSTFMVEMTETAYILRHATEKSLIIMDEIGRGTSTYDGISIAWAVAEYLATTIGKQAKTLFATHYHELKNLEHRYPERIKNFHMEVIEKDGQPVFLHTLLPGAASTSFGIEVANMAGLPQEVIYKAKALLQTYESSHAPQIHMESHAHHTNSLEQQIRSIDISRTTPLQALTILASLQEQILYEKNTQTS